ncbi:MAG TPA: tetratricopeptide repeat protein [Burkholderiaceae bacterium]|nr:tetratricopeptide repeat protein [Burkholderiaceae bacterium]
MTAYLLLLLSFVLVALAIGVWVALPLVRSRAPADADRTRDANLAVLRERRRELERELESLPAGSPQRRSALAEFAAQVRHDLDDDARPDQRSGSAAAGDPASAPGAAAPSMPRRRPALAVAIALLLALPALAFYLASGFPEIVAPQLLAQGASDADLDRLAEQLRARAQAEPQRADAWHLLGRAEMARGRLDAARDAFERAHALQPDSAQAAVDLADAIAQLQGARLDGRPIELVRRALELDADNQKALALAGAYAVTQGRAADALAHWQRLLALLPPDSPQAAQIGQFVENLKAGRAPLAAAAAPGAARVDVQVSLAPALREQVSPQDTLFVVARAVDERGVPVGPPVAVLRTTAAALPGSFTLDDSMAMTPSARLSGAERVAIVARISRAGSAAAAAGDLQGVSAVISPADGAAASAVIDTIVQ